MGQGLTAFLKTRQTTMLQTTMLPTPSMDRRTKDLSTCEAGRGHASPHVPAETAKCWWLLKIEPNAWAGGKGSCAVCVDLQAVGTLKFFGELYSLAIGFGPF